MVRVGQSPWGRAELFQVATGVAILWLIHQPYLCAGAVPNPALLQRLRCRLEAPISQVTIASNVKAAERLRLH